MLAPVPTQKGTEEGSLQHVKQAQLKKQTGEASAIKPIPFSVYQYTGDKVQTTTEIAHL